jgi:hypothetical protein
MIWFSRLSVLVFFPHRKLTGLESGMDCEGIRKSLDFKVAAGAVWLRAKMGSIAASGESTPPVAGD